MTQLQTLQTQFQNALLADQPAQAGLLSTRGVAQFSVYRHAYRARLRGALRDNFEVLPLVMGDDAFDALANAYIDAHPSRHYSLRWFGHALGDFMAGHGSLVDHPAMTDLARMEWALRTAFDAAPATLLTPAELAAVPAQDWAQLVHRAPLGAIAGFAMGGRAGLARTQIWSRCGAAPGSLAAPAAGLAPGHEHAMEVFNRHRNRICAMPAGPKELWHGVHGTVRARRRRKCRVGGGATHPQYADRRHTLHPCTQRPAPIRHGGLTPFSHVWRA